MRFPWTETHPSFYDHFEAHAREGTRAAELLRQILRQGSSAVDIAQQVRDCEHAADVITHEVVKRASTTFITPIDREDILALTHALDNVVDNIYKSSREFVTTYGLTEATEPARMLAEIILQGTHCLLSICQLLRHPGANAVEIRRLCIELHRLENLGDEIKADARRDLFMRLERGEVAMPLYIAWEKMYGLLEVVTDDAEDCANVADQILMKYA